MHCRNLGIWRGQEIIPQAHHKALKVVPHRMIDTEIEACMHPCIHSVDVGKHYIVNNCIIIICSNILTNFINMINI